MSFQNKVVCITGAGSGIGRATALAFAEAGAALMLSDINSAGLDASAEQCAAFGHRVVTCRADQTQAPDVDAMVQLTLAKLGKLHIAVNSAGISGRFGVPLADYDEREYERVMDVNVRGVWLGMRAQIPAILGSGGGAIVNLASVAGMIGVPGGGLYSASKHAVIGLSRSAALEYGARGVRVNALCPSFIDTPMVRAMTDADAREAERVRKASPLRRLGTPEEVASAIVYLCGDGASFINGAVIAVDGGLTAM